MGTVDHFKIYLFDDPEAANCYLVENRELRELFIVDPGAYGSEIADQISRIGAKPVAILLTHGHYDHIMAVPELRARFHLPVYIHRLDEPMLKSPEGNLSARFARPFETEADHMLEDGQELTLAGFQIRCIHTPGHTPGSCCYELPKEKLLFSGDTLFRRSVGRTDFPQGSFEQLQESIHRLVKMLPGETLVYPGHLSDTTISEELRYNPFV